MIRGWESIVPRCGRTSTLSRATAPAAYWLYEPQPICNQPICNRRFRSLVDGVMHVWRYVLPGNGTSSSQGSEGP